MKRNKGDEKKEKKMTRTEEGLEKEKGEKTRKTSGEEV